MKDGCRRRCVAAVAELTELKTNLESVSTNAKDSIEHVEKFLVVYHIPKVENRHGRHFSGPKLFNDMAQ